MEFQGIMEKIIVAHPFKKFPVFCGTWRLITWFTRACTGLVLIWIQSMLRQSVSLKSILILSSNLFLLLSPKCKYYPQLSFLKTSFYILSTWSIRFLGLTQENSLELHEFSEKVFCFAQHHSNYQIYQNLNDGYISIDQLVSSGSLPSFFPTVLKDMALELISFK
jgi:hypothetical protein